jgi:hypothetical protein
MNMLIAIVQAIKAAVLSAGTPKRLLLHPCGSSSPDGAGTAMTGPRRPSRTSEVCYSSRRGRPDEVLRSVSSASGAGYRKPSAPCPLTRTTARLLWRG